MSKPPATPRTGPNAPPASAATAPLALLDVAILPSPLSDAADAQRVGDIMTLHLRQMDVATTLAQAAQEMVQARVSSLIVTRNKLPVGILTALIGGPVFLLLLRGVVRQQGGHA